MSTITVRSNKTLETIEVHTSGGQSLVIHLAMGTPTLRRSIIDVITALCVEANFQTKLILE